MSQKLIPTLIAISKTRGNLPGGSSNPWVVTVYNQGKYEEYVVKLYTDRNLSVVPLNNKEIYAAILAQELEIPTPPPALIKFTKDFINNLEDEEDKKRIEKLPCKVVFGCKFFAGFMDVPIPVNINSFTNLNPETIFAFDVLIRNFDRRKNKPNLITRGDSFYCIDHENSLHVNKLFSQYNFQDWAPFNSKGDSCHLFYNYLQKQKNIEFLEFVNLFKTFKIHGLDEVSQCLTNNHWEIEDLEETKEYLLDVINNKQKFYNLLKSLIA